MYFRENGREEVSMQVLANVSAREVVANCSEHKVGEPFIIAANFSSGWQEVLSTARWWAIYLADETLNLSTQRSADLWVAHPFCMWDANKHLSPSLR